MATSKKNEHDGRSKTGLYGKKTIEILWIIFQSSLPTVVISFLFSQNTSIAPSMMGILILAIVTVLAAIAVCLFFDNNTCDLKTAKMLKHFSIGVLIVIGIIIAVKIIGWFTLYSVLTGQGRNPASDEEWILIAKELVYCFIIEGIAAVFLIYIVHKGNNIRRSKIDNYWRTLFQMSSIWSGVLED